MNMNKKYLIEDGKVFDGTLEEFQARFSANADEDGIRLYCEKHNLSFKIVDDRPYFDNFDDYVTAYPEAEHFRNWMMGKLRPLLILPTTNKQSCPLPGGYIWATLAKEITLPPKRGVGRKFPPAIHINDCDDGFATQTFASDAEAEAVFEVLKLLIPVAIADLTEAFGFKY